MLLSFSLVFSLDCFLSALAPAGVSAPASGSEKYAPSLACSSSFCFISCSKFNSSSVSSSLPCFPFSIFSFSLSFFFFFLLPPVPPPFSSTSPFSSFLCFFFFLCFFSFLSEDVECFLCLCLCFFFFFFSSNSSVSELVSEDSKSNSSLDFPISLDSEGLLRRISN
uniref:Agouti signaling protein n=1 Tax=Cacopsylla melanoneura TaxID=428564 RepID=A0A8D8VF98_9HEMI